MKKVILIKVLAAVIFASAFLPLNAQTEYWDLLDPLPETTGFPIGVVFDGKIYIIGGYYDMDDPAITSVLSYDPKTDTYDESIADLPMGLGRGSATVLNGKIYVSGGDLVDLGDSYTRKMFEYDPMTNTWTSKADMLKPRVYHSLVTLGDKLVALGGRSQPWPLPLDSTVEIYDPVLDSWTFVSDLPYSAGVFTTTVRDGKLYVLGGSYLANIYPYVHVYDPEMDTWTRRNDMPDARHLHGSAVIDDEIYLFGGSNASHMLPNMWTWDFDDNWTIHDNILMTDSLAFVAHGMAEDGSGNECLFAFGGVHKEYWTQGTPPPYVVATAQKYCPGAVTSEQLPEIDAFRVFPNPASAFMTIKIQPGLAGQFFIQLIDLSGRKVISLSGKDVRAGPDTYQFDIRDLPSGMYFLTLYSSETQKSMPVVIATK